MKQVVSWLSFKALTNLLALNRWRQFVVCYGFPKYLIFPCLTAYFLLATSFMISNQWRTSLWSLCFVIGLEYHLTCGRPRWLSLDFFFFLSFCILLSTLTLSHACKCKCDWLILSWPGVLTNYSWQYFILALSFPLAGFSAYLLSLREARHNDKYTDMHIHWYKCLSV